MKLQLTGLPPAAAAAYSRSSLPAALAAIAVTLLCLLPGISPVHAQDGVAGQGSVQTVNINADNATEMAAGLTGVGLTRAEDIVRYREQFGPFTTVEQLAEVKGIGTATLDKNRARIKLD
ncbi:hypothetical protein F0M18_07095 [Pseudohalioglobus sediminis]|uniref:Competence protein ComEA n=1 Tax=Pseudohalioglobus sediminis TaxID=2606449 RepID=A0A5B0WZC9_9GAMM|nr:helix-hairpin-helix domain-containing protein [Pseudohalioglobus sediminis]KAA1192430.1 hypothetical protein F0M18_07095 [Pseudohalioglobus sediminis]